MNSISGKATVHLNGQATCSATSETSTHAFNQNPNAFLNTTKSDWASHHSLVGSSSWIKDAGFVGSVDEFWMVDRVLSASELTHLMTFNEMPSLGKST